MSAVDCQLHRVVEDVHINVLENEGQNKNYTFLKRLRMGEGVELISLKIIEKIVFEDVFYKQ